MMSEKILKEIIRWLSFSILFLPLLVIKTTLFPYIFSKIIFFQIAVEIIFALWLILIVCEKKYRPNFKNPLLLSITIFMGILILTSFLGQDPSRSFFSTQERMTGTITFFHFYLWFLVLGSLFKDVADWRKFIWASLIASFLVGLYGIGQKLGLEFLPKGSISRWAATLGNPIYLSVYAMLHIFLAGFLILQERKKILKALLIILILFNLVIMSFGASRGVILSFGFSLFLFFIFLIIQLPSKKIKVFVSFLLILIISGFVFLQTEKAKPFVAKSPVFLKRIVATKEMDWTRTSSWQAAFEGFKEKPVLGWGWENYNLVFNKFFNPRYLEAGFANTWFDKSHNQVLDILCLTGIFGLLSYLAFFFFIFKALFKKSREYRLPLGSVILSLMLVAYFLQNLFVFDTPAPLISFYLSLGLIYFYCKSAEPDNINLDDSPWLSRAERRRKLSGYSGLGKNLILIPIILIFLFISIYKLNILPFNKSQDGAKGAIISPINFELGLYFYKNSLKESSFTNPEIRLMLARTILEETEKADEKSKKEGLEFAISEMKKNTKEHPLDVKYYLALGKLYQADFNFEKAENAFEKAVELSPKRQEVYYELGQNKVSQGEFSEAAKLYQIALKLNEKIRDSHWYYGIAAILAEDYKEGIKEIEKAHEMGRGFGKNPQILSIIANGYAQLGEIDKALKVLKDLAKIDKDLADKIEKLIH